MTHKPPVGDSADWRMGPSSSRSGPQRSLAECVSAVAYSAMAYWYYRWDWGESVAFDGLARVPHIPGVNEFIGAELDRWVRESESPINRFGPARCLISRHRDSPRESTADFLKRLAQQYAALPLHGEVVLLDPPSTTVYVDSLYGEPAMLAELSSALGDMSLESLAVDLALGHVRSLQLESGLMAHVRDVAQSQGPRIAWGRGNGWAALGLSELLTRLTPAAAGYDELLQRYRRLCTVLVEFQVPGGGWRNLIDEPASYPEASASLLITAALNLGRQAGLLDARHTAAATSAWGAIRHRVDPSGHVVGVSYRPGVNTDPARYEHTPTVGAYPWGQGPYLLAAAQAIEASGGDT